MYQRQFQKIQAQTTAHLAQTMTLLSMNVDELTQEIEKVVSENPAIVLHEERCCPTCKRLLQDNQKCPICSNPNRGDTNDPIIFISPKDNNRVQTPYDQDDQFSDDYLGTVREDLPEYVLKQIAFDLQQDERRIAAYLLTQLDEDGFIKEDWIDIANYFHVNLEKIEKIIRIINRADPIGVGTRSPEEALIAQLEILKETNSIPDYYTDIIKMGFDAISHKYYKEIAKHTGKQVVEIKDAINFIGNNLNPFPARAHWGSTRNPGMEESQVYMYPDVILSYLNNDPDKQIIAEIILPLQGYLEVNNLYKQALKQADDDTKPDLKKDLEKASLFIKCLQQRNYTMQRLMEIIVRLQSDFIKKGNKFYKPITRAAISEKLKVHESTISRAVANKSIQLPDGQIVPMSIFFDRSLAVRTEIIEIIGNEITPLGDDQIMEKLKERGHKVARRTVAKYRAMEGILPSHLRKQVNKDANFE